MVGICDVRWHDLQTYLSSFDLFITEGTLLVFRKKDLYLIITQKLTFHEIRRISPVKSVWNPPDFTREICMKSTGFHLKSTRFNEIHMKSTGFHEIRMKSAGFRKTIARNGKPYVLHVHAFINKFYQCVINSNLAIHTVASWVNADIYKSP